MADDPRLELPKELRSAVEASLEQARKALDGMVMAAHQALDEGERRGSRITDNAREASRTAMDYITANMTAGFEFAARLAKARTVQEWVKLQQDFAAEQARRLSEQVGALGEAVGTAQRRAAGPAPAAAPEPAPATPPPPKPAAETGVAAASAGTATTSAPTDRASAAAAPDPAAPAPKTPAAPPAGTSLSGTPLAADPAAPHAADPSSTAVSAAAVAASLAAGHTAAPAVRGRGAGRPRGAGRKPGPKSG